MVLMPGCPHSVCKECFKGHFTNVMKTQSVKHFNCPVCALPDMTDPQIETYLMLLMPLVSEMPFVYQVCFTVQFNCLTRSKSILTKKDTIYASRSSWSSTSPRNQIFVGVLM